MSTLFQGQYANNETIIYQILKSNGYNLAQICGILANIEDECSFNPKAVNTGEGAYGICQWRSGRKSTLFSKYGSNPSLHSQVSFIDYEFKTSESKAYSHFSNIGNNRNGASLAGYNFAKYYERCAAVYHNTRGQRAAQYWDFYSGNPVSSINPVNDLAFSEGSISGGTTSVGSNIPAYRALSTLDPYADIIAENLSRVTAKGFDYGHLIDLTYNSGDFKFYIPEFDESAGANWGDIDIPGRSVTIKAYRSTNSRVINISLDLYAGAGLYSSGTDVVGDLHRDLNFVKSLEYPDYDGPIIRPPANVLLILGSNISMQGVISNVRVNHLKPLDDQNRSMYAKLSFTVTQLVSDPPGRSDILGGVSAIISTENPSTLS